MADFEDSKIFKVARVTYDAVQMFKSVASKIYDSAINSYTGNAIENKRVVRSAMRSVKEGLKSFKNYISNKTEDLIFDGKEKLGQLRDWGNDKKDTLHYYLLEGQKKGKDLLDTAHYNLLVAGDKVKPLKDLSLKSFKPLQTVGKAGLNGAAKIAGLAANAISGKYQSFMKGAEKIMTRTSARKRLALRSVRHTLNDARTSLTGWFTKKGKINSGWENLQKKVGKVFSPAVKMFNKAAKPLQTAGKAGLNGAALVGGLAMAGATKVYTNSSEFVKDQYNLAKDTVTKVGNWGKEFADKADSAVNTGLAMAGVVHTAAKNKFNDVKEFADAQYDAFKEGAGKIMTRASARKRLARRNVKRALKDTGKSVTGWFNTKKEQLKSGLESVKTSYTTKVQPAAAKMFNKVAKPLQTVGKAGLNGAALAGGLAMAGATKVYTNSSEFVKDQYNSAKDMVTKVGTRGKEFADAQYDAFKEGAEKIMTRASARKRLARRNINKTLNQYKGLFGKYKETARRAMKDMYKDKKEQLKTDWKTAKSKVKNSKVVTSVKEFADKTNTAVNTGMAMAGVVHAAAKKQWNDVKKVTGEKATEFMNGANRRIMGGLNMANNVVNNIVNGGKETLTAVGQTLTSARDGINQGIATAKQAVKEQARGNAASWYRLGQMQGR